ncbi:MAG: (2Fe-2S)-binding protein [Chloroflexi bacterium]|nr:(2Fe-2S)-binding protein [Chloroflexota bacterium]
MRLIFDGKPIEFNAGDTVLAALLKAGIHPAGGGPLCCGGDCPHCLATIGGASYARTCQTPARPGMIVERHPANGYPPLPTNNLPGPEVSTRHLHCDVIVIGQGRSGRAAAEEAKQAGKRVVTLDEKEGQEALGIYEGPLVIARTSQGMWHVHAREVIVATGAAEIQPVAPGNQLAGIFTARATETLAAAGVNLGRVVAIGEPPRGVEAENVQGQIVRFEGEKKVEAVVVRGPDGNEKRFACDSVSVGLGLNPRDTLLRMGNGLNVRAVGEAAREPDLPICPTSGTVCSCSGVTVEDLDRVWNSGFREMELIKRATLAGTGTCQGGMCTPYLRSFIKARGGELQPAFTARPVTRQPTLAEAAAGAHHRPTPRTALDAEHRRLGAYMDRVGGWWRPWNYGNVLEEYWAVREAVSIGDVSTLGKMLVSGPDALKLLEHLYPTKVSTIGPGRSRYVLILDERGYVFDDGLICNEGDGRYYLTFTSGGSSFAEMWVRDWADALKLDARLMYQTMSLGAINVTGPLSRELLSRAGFTTPLNYMQHTKAEVGGVACRVLRLSFTGEQSYELHHPADQSAALWRRLLELGADLGIKPHGIETLLKLRLEKGHVIVGQDTDFDTTARRIDMEWALKLDKGDFVGRQAVLRTNKELLDKQLAGLEMDGPAPLEGAVIWRGDEYAGYVTSSAYSPVLGKAVMLGWVKLFDGELPAQVVIEGRPARRAAVPFYDKESNRARA